MMMYESHYSCSLFAKVELNGEDISEIDGRLHKRIAELLRQRDEEMCREAFGMNEAKSYPVQADIEENNRFIPKEDDVIEDAVFSPILPECDHE